METESTAATYVGMHGCVAQCMVLQSLLVYFVCHYILLISIKNLFYYLFIFAYLYIKLVRYIPAKRDRLEMVRVVKLRK